MKNMGFLQISFTEIDIQQIFASFACLLETKKSLAAKMPLSYLVKHDVAYIQQFVEVNGINGKDQSSTIPSFQTISNPIQNKEVLIFLHNYQSIRRFQSCQRLWVRSQVERIPCALFARNADGLLCFCVMCAAQTWYCV
jgi:hypothetical protein